MSVCKFGVGKGVNGGCTPLPIHPQQYCDLASLVPLTRERETDRERERERQTDRQRDTQTKRQRDKQRNRHTDGQTDANKKTTHRLPLPTPLDVATLF